MRTASNAPGAFPDSPTAARSLTVSRNRGDQNPSSDNTYDTPSFGYVCNPNPDPNALLPSTRTPPVTNSRSRHPIISCAKKPALMTRCSFSLTMLRNEPDVSVGMPGAEKLLAVRSV